MPSQHLNGFAPAKKSQDLPGFAPAKPSGTEPSVTGGPPDAPHVAAVPRQAEPQPPFRGAPRVGTNYPQRPSGGDFRGDLLPGGHDPLRVGGAMPAGNLMGPDHPLFAGGSVVGGGHLDFNPHDDFRSGFGMRPRFDPFGPPGGPQEITDPNHPLGQRRGGPGNPNPDHLQPPNSLGGNNMFL